MNVPKTDTPIDNKIVDQKILESGLENVGKASIREIRRLIDHIETASGKNFIRMEMGIPGLKAPAIAIEAEIAALKSGVAEKYPEVDGLPLLKQEISRFARLFMDIDVSPEGCIPSVGSLQGALISYLTIENMHEHKDTLLFLDPGFPLHKQQLNVIRQKHESFDVYNYRGSKLHDKLESCFKKRNIHSVLYSNPNNPSWICFTDEELRIIGELCNKYDVIPIEDLAYFGMDFRKDLSQPGKPPFQPTVAKYTDHYIILISCSKLFSYAGQRLGLMIISDKLFNRREPALKRHYTTDKFGMAVSFGTIYALCAGVTHSTQYGIAAILKEINDGKYNFREDVLEYGKKAHIMKKMFLENGFRIVYDKDGDEPIADGFYFTVCYPGLSGEELIHEFMYYGISAISLANTGSERKEGIRACVSLIQRDQFPELEQRLKKFHEHHPL